MDIQPIDKAKESLPLMHLSGAMVPVVQEYTYLGLVLDDQLNLDVTVTKRVYEARKNASLVAR